MKQVVLRNGQPHVATVPAPSPQPGRVLVANAASVISSGTERSAVAVSGGSLPMRAIRNPELVKLALEHTLENGVRSTAGLVRGAVNDDVVMGYSSAGVVLDTGGISAFRVGQRVACAGAAKAAHAEVVSVPGNLVAPVPDGVSLRDAAFTTLGSIALQGVRRTQPELGDRVVVVGLGLLGVLTTQLLAANGCDVLGVEPVQSRREAAVALGLERAVAPEDAKAAVAAWTGEVGADAVVVCASAATDSILNDAIEMTRRKGRVVPVGDVGFGIDRAPLYQREADVLISTSYGPGRYDATYEEGGLDYPIAYVRWTENRNMEEFLRLVAAGKVQVGPLAELELPADDADQAYSAIKAEQPPFAAVLLYEGAEDRVAGRETVDIAKPRRRERKASGKLGVGLVGPGSFTRATHLPRLKDERIVHVAARTGTTASDVARGAGGGKASTDWHAVVEDPDVELVVIGTRHDTHAEIAAAALRAGKAVFVEKPLGLTHEQIDDVWQAGGGAEAPLSIGFNRPFAPLSQRIMSELSALPGPRHVVYRVNAPLPAGHWLNDPEQGGGRLLGEGCHMLDYANWLCGTPVRVAAAALPTPAGRRAPESASVTVEYENGSVATVHYSGAGHPSMPKERVEVLCDGRSWVLDDYVRLTTWGADGEQTHEGSGKTDKGHAALLDAVLAAAKGDGAWPAGLPAAYAAQQVALWALEAISTGQTVELTGPPALSPA